MRQQVDGVGGATIKVLQVIGTGAIVLGSLAVPNLAGALAPILKKTSGLSEEQARRAVRYGLNKNWLTYREDGDSVTLFATNQGHIRRSRAELNTPLSSIKWDKKWRIVIFDVPNSRNLSRDALRGHLKRVGFRQLQESVWVTPHNCSDLIVALKTIYKLTDKEVRLIEAKSFDGDTAYKQLFKLIK